MPATASLAPAAFGRRMTPARRGGASGAATTDARAGFGLAEALVALVVLSAGLLAVAGIALAVSSQTRAGANTTARVLAGQQVLESMVEAGYGSVPTGDTTVIVGNRTFTVSRSIAASGVRWQEIRVRVGAAGDPGTETLGTRVHAPRPPPTSAP